MLAIKKLYLKLGAANIVLLLLACAIISSVLFTTKTSYAALAQPPYSTAGLNAKLYGGVQQAIDWDSQCYNGLVRERRNSGESQRTMINQSPSYQGEQWLSLADSPTQNNSSRTAPIVVDYGTTTVPLQLNMIKFLCAGLVSPDGAGAYFSYNDPRVVRSLNNADDRNPNSLCGTNGVSPINCPALTDSRFRIDNIQVTQGNGHITGAAIGRYIGTSRQGNTRYWFANPVGFNFVSDSPNGITANTQIQIRFTLRGYNTYYYDVYQCYSNNVYTYPPNSLNINICNQNVVTLSIMVNVRNHFILTPTVSLNGQTSITSGGTAQVKNTVAVSAGSTNSDSTDWRTTELDYAPGTTLSPADTAARDSGGDPCSSFTGGGRTACNTVQENGSMIFNVPSTTFNPQYGYTAPDTLPVGTKVCFVASVSKPTPAATPLWRHSDMECMTVGKQPKTQIWGSDLAVRGQIETSTTVKSIGGGTQVFGSWVEYGSFSIGPNSHFASASGLNGQTNNSQTAWSALTFANVDTNGNPAFGNYATAASFRPLSTAAAYFATLPNQQAIAGGSVDLAATPGLTFATGGTPVIHTAGNLTITGGAIPAGRSVIILATGTVTIDGPITYTNNPLSQLSDIPQVVIIAGNINIKDSVPQVDAWLLTTGTLNTCYNFAGNLTASKCNTPLTVNGPVVTGRLLLNRTAGGDTGAQSGDPAERFNLRPDAYLWASLQATGNDKAQTVYMTELAPRF